MTAHVPFGDISAIEATLFRYQMSPGEVAAIFVEAVQGEGGVRPADLEFLKSLRALADKHGLLLCFDEETGKFLWQHSNEKLPSGRVHDWPEQGKGVFGHLRD